MRVSICIKKDPGRRSMSLLLAEREGRCSAMPYSSRLGNLPYPHSTFKFKIKKKKKKEISEKKLYA
jgi:hypothetical protein